ncbi:MBOAT family protein, partial [Aliarcobacter butzleri]
IFFRAKDFESAMKVFGSMLSFDNVVLPSIFFKKLAFLENYGIKFDEVTRSISGGSDLLNLTLVSMIIVFFFKNSMQLKDKFKSNIFILVFTVFLFVYSMFSLNKFSEFLYFNF